MLYVKNLKFLVPRRRLVVDFDGTLTRWQTGDPIEKVSSDGYCRYLPAHENLVKALRDPRVLAKYEEYIWSSVLPYEWVIPDKNFWADRETPQIAAERRLYTPFGVSKMAYINDVFEPRKGDVYLDDYTYNLFEAEELTKLTPVKAWDRYVNGTKGRWAAHNGAVIDVNAPAEEITMALLAM